MSLTAKQQRFVEEYLTVQVSALRQVVRHLGVKPNPALLRNEQKWAVVLRMVDPAALPVQRAACAFMLDMVSADWRSVAGPLLGYVVDRNSAEVRAWRRAVIANDNRECRHCSSTERLHAHHIVRWADAPHLRVTVSNGMTLCETCHIAEHQRSA